MRSGWYPSLDALFPKMPCRQNAPTQPKTIDDLSKEHFRSISLLCYSLDSSLLQVSNWNRRNTTEPLNRMAVLQDSSNTTPCLGIFGIDAFNHSHDKIMETFTECLQENLRLSTGPICWQAELVLALAYCLTCGKCHWGLATFTWEGPSKRISTIP